MPNEMIVALNIIFTLFVLMAVRIAWRINQEGGRRMGEHFNGRGRW